MFLVFSEAMSKSAINLGPFQSDLRNCSINQLMGFALCTRCRLCIRLQIIRLSSPRPLILISKEVSIGSYRIVAYSDVDMKTSAIIDDIGTVCFGVT